MAYTITDLESYYNQQLGNIASMVEESVGVDRSRVKLIAKVLPVLNHHVCTGFGISKQYYGDSKQKMGGTGQGNCFSGNNSRDISCFVIRQLEIEKLGAMIKAPISQITMQRAALVFVDNTNIYTNGLESKKRI